MHRELSDIQGEPNGSRRKLNDVYNELSHTHGEPNGSRRKLNDVHRDFIDTHGELIDKRAENRMARTES